MLRIYAVPSEELRVWSIWLSQISDEAELWQKWLCSHVNLFLRMASRLKKFEEEHIAELKTLQPEMVEEIRRIFAYEEDAIADDGIEYPEGVEDFYDIEQVLADIVSGKEKSVEEKDEGEERALEESEEWEEEKEKRALEKIEEGDEEEEEEERALEETEEGEAVEEETVNEEVVNETEEGAEGEKGAEGEEGEERLGGGADQPEETTNEEDTTEEVKEEEEVKETEEEEEEKEKEGEEEEEKESDEIVEKKDKDEKVDDDTSEYLKEWPLGIQWEPLGIQKEKDPTDIIEVTTIRNSLHFRLELPETVEEMQEMIRNFTIQATIYRSYFKHWMETGEQAIKEMVGRTIMSTAKLRNILKDEKPEASLKQCLNYPRGTPRRNLCFSPPIKLAQMTALAKRIGTEEFMKEMARAEEDIPYFFYRKIDPDIEIAIKHNDEEVIPMDPDNEFIFGNYESLRFNLTDKPGKDGKIFMDEE
ncbi:golgin subfamily A member 6-like protein 22 isoform X2 [Vespula maculifrons]|uniref:Golgin subfamily A member 6-like protein 22 isoform X2 n=1 Tax=Vespula maculifrons TaxID=7453 RepID=A0ABD2CAX8_VESMC